MRLSENPLITPPKQSLNSQLMMPEGYKKDLSISTKNYGNPNFSQLNSISALKTCYHFLQITTSPIPFKQMRTLLIFGH
jgi:hypothetical protein